LQHLLVIGILILSVSISMLIRSTPASYGLELFEFDPFFNYRATEYILENGLNEYFEWIDDKSWYPYGRNVSETSQVTLHISTSILYQLFGFNSSLYDFTILFPMIIGSLSAVVVFAFVRVLGGTSAGLFAALIFAISAPIFSRGLIGWFKSEPLGLFLAFIAMYLFISGLKFNKGKISLIKLSTAGFFLSLGLSAWGGILFFVLGIALFYFLIPFFKNDKNFLIWACPTFSISLILFSLMFERSSMLIIGYAGIVILLPTIFVIVSELIKHYSSESTKVRNCIILLVSLVVSGVSLFNSGQFGSPSFRYLNAINPFLTTTDPLTDSVAEHMTTSLNLQFTFLSVFMVFGLIGIWILFSKKSKLKTDMRLFSILIGIIAIYVSSSFVRLELFASVAIIILGSIGLASMLEQILAQKNNYIAKIIFPIVILALFVIPVTMPENNSWLDWADFPPSILSGGSTFSQHASNDWLATTTWIKENVPEDAVIASWWDYGYWITTLGERTTLVDNSTLIDWAIKKMGYTLITTPNNSWNILNSHYTEDISPYLGEKNIIEWGGETQSDFILNYTVRNFFDDPSKNYNELSSKEKKLIDDYIAEKGTDDCNIIMKSNAQKLGVSEQFCHPLTKGMNADYILIYLAGERFYISDTNIPLYTLEGGGDESKKTWFAKISNHQVSKFVQSDNITPTDYYLEESTLGVLTPFSIVKFVEPNTGRTFDEFAPGFVPVYAVNMKLTQPDTDPYILVYASPSFYSEQPGVMSAVLIYKINNNYQSIN
ncbi:MAG: hypothetical protein CL872_05895, partial [Dehalococcoidaceae bacterium]|nr:hypothetical protein [Dehalococcoidaceae bacterium]